ncbi:hypothetical protein SSS_01562 [Sarcoptes scabiei]|uniref:Uncharacterized protein n=1 Tax=Sarcoptes scabiei TaxID=52283 RepID=A0A834R631_SARSC|nr:hypothetical protein SSS_01562 [Sarcoptes scabiei]
MHQSIYIAIEFNLNNVIIFLMILSNLNTIMINAQQLTNSASLSSDLTLESGLSSQSSPNRTVNDHIHSIIHRFDLSKPIKRNQIESNRSSLIFVTDQQTTTFRPSSAILYLHPPKPKHIESIETRFNGIELMNSKLIIKWSLNVKLRTANNQIESNDDDRNNMDQNNGQNNGTDDGDHDLPLSNRSKRNILNAAKIELEQKPIQFRIHLRRYGSKQRQRFLIIDRNNTLDPPKTDNQTYEYSIDRLDTSSAYEFCLQSVNAGQIYASEELNRKFPCDAQTDIAGRNNPLFLCKEIVFNDQSENHDRKEGRSQIADHQFNATNQTATTTATKKIRIDLVNH